MDKPTQTTLYAVFKDGERVQPYRMTIEEAKTDAHRLNAFTFDKKLGYMNSALTFVDGYEIKGVPHVEA